MSINLETYRGLITDLWQIQRLNEEEIVSHLQEERGFTIDFFQLHTYLEQWKLIPSPSPTYSYPEEPSRTTQYEEQQYHPLEEPAPQQTTSFHNTSGHESSMLLGNSNTGPTPLERYATDDQTHERLALRLSSLTSSTSTRSDRPRRVEKTKKKRGVRGEKEAEGSGRAKK